MYSTDGHLPVADLASGTSLLVHGPPMSGKRALCFSLLGAGARDERPVIVSTDSTVSSLRSEFEPYLEPGRSATDVAVVDCTGEYAGEDTQLVRTVSSPADLTGIGMATTNLLESLHVDGCERFRVGFCSLTSVFLYAEPERAVKFVHVMTQRIAESGALGVFAIQPDSVEPDVFNQLRTLVDATVELRETDDAERECRLRGLPDAPDEWQPLDLAGEPESASAVAGDTATAGGRQASTERIDDSNWLADEAADGDWLAGSADAYDSLAAVIERVDDERPTLSVYEFEGDQAALDALADHCEVMNVAFRERDLGPDDPANVAMLHRGRDLIDAVPVQALLGALEVTESDVSGDEFAVTEGTDLLADLSRSTFGARGANKRFLLDVSHVIETEAWRHGAGELHAGFQDISRLWNDDEARRIYRRLAESGVAVHVYGRPDTDAPDWDGITVHGVDNDEIAASWFVVYDGAGDPDEKAMLLTQERDLETYHGFWTYRSDRTDDTLAYLRTTYGDETGVGDATGHDSTTP
jgi:KaiC/GvpD/RAD55 family RecA-like ATPase